ncbi:MAG: PAS domain S-box protein, partial [FCB group bacterium]|nr:PAS domain S-box protein [FCB group bacterium]
MSEKQINRAQLLEELEKLQAKVKTLEISEAKYKYLFEKSQAVNMLVGKDGKILEVNNWAAELFGYDRNELIGRNPLEFVVPEQWDKAKEQLGLVLKCVSTSSFEVDVIGKEDIRTLLFAEGKGILYHKGETVGVLLSALDITEHKRTEAEATALATERERTGEALRESEEKYRMLVEKVQDGFFIIQDGLMAFVNEAFASMAGYTVEEVIGMDFRKLVAPEDLTMVAERYKRRQEGKPVPPAYEFRLLHKDGKTRVNVFMTVGIIDYQGKVASIGTVHNIGERKKAEEELEQINKLIRQERHMFISGPVVVFKWQNKEGWPVEYVSPNVKDVFGYSVEEIFSIPYAEIIPKEDIDRVGNEVVTYSESGVENFEHKPYRIIRKDGKIIWIADYTTILRDEAGNITHYLGYIIDITESKQAEEALQASEMQYRTVVENAREFIWQLDVDGNFVFFNKFAEEVSGQKSDDWKGKHFKPLVHPDDLEYVMNIFNDTLSGNDNNYDTRIFNKKGEIVHLRVLTTPIIKEGKVVGTISFGRDITEQKRAEEALRESEELNRGIVINAPVGIVYLDKMGE